MMQSAKEEFIQLISDYQGIIHKVCLIYFDNKTDREDNFQEIIFQLWKSYPQFRNKESTGSWIYSVSLNTSISRIKKVNRIEYRKSVPDIPDKSDFIEKITRNESLQVLLKAIHKLNEIDKSIVFLYLEEKSYEEIASITGLTSTNVGVRINRAKELLKKIIKKEEHGK